MPEVQGILQAVYDPTTASLRTSGSGDSIWLPPNAFTILAGTPAIVNTNLPGWAFDAAADESIHATFMLPSFFPWLAVDYLWCNDGAGAGNVRWAMDLKTLTPGTDLISEAVVTTAVTTAAGAQNVVVQSADLVPLLAASNNTLYGLGVRRDADDAADTLANDVRLLGVRLRRPI